MKLKLYINLLLLVLFACNNSDNYTPSTLPKNQKAKTDSVIIKENKKPIIKQDTIQKDTVKPIKRFPRILSYNVKKILTNYGDTVKSNKILIKTNYGNMTLKLYDDTPLHRANFVMLIKRKIFDNTLFYRVIKDFMIQGGNADDPKMQEKIAGLGSYNIPSEIMSHHFHKKGALAMAVPYANKEYHDNASSAINFYIVQGSKQSSSILKGIEKQYKIKIPSNQKSVYRSIGGSPHLDGGFTVFGELTSGFNVLQKISKVKTQGTFNTPIEEVRIIEMKVLN